MGETNSPSVAHVAYDISPLSRMENYRNPRATEGESIYNPNPFQHLEKQSSVSLDIPLTLEMGVVL